MKEIWQSILIGLLMLAALPCISYSFYISLKIWGIVK